MSALGTDDHMARAVPAAGVETQDEDGRGADFAIRRPDDRAIGSTAMAIARNREFAAAGGHAGAVVFPRLGLFVITCLDPRTDPAHFLGLDLSDAMVVRNAGGRVTRSVIDDVALIAQIAERAIPNGPLFEVAVIHHNQCGTATLAADGFRSRYAERIAVEESTLHARAVLEPELTVAADVALLRDAPAVPARVRVSGHVYDVLTGLVQTVVPSV
jgi:carbonic anhydrase